MSAAAAPGAAWLLLALLVACASPASPPAPDLEPAAEAAGPLIERGERLRAEGDLEGALAAYAQAHERTPWNERIVSTMAAIHSDRAAYYYEEGKLVPAEKDLRAALELAPDDPRARDNLARVLLSRAELDLDAEQAAARRAEAERLVPGISAGAPLRDGARERRLDLAFELLERGQLEAGIERLEQLRERYPEDPEVAGVLGSALARQAGELADAGHFDQAAELLDRAVAIYLALPGCRAPDWTDCALDEARIAHHNRIVAWLNAGRPSRARQALADAEGVGLSFPEIANVLGGPAQ